MSTNTPVEFISKIPLSIDLIGTIWEFQCAVPNHGIDGCKGDIIQIIKIRNNDESFNFHYLYSSAECNADYIKHDQDDSDETCLSLAWALEWKPEKVLVAYKTKEITCDEETY